MTNCKYDCTEGIIYTANGPDDFDSTYCPFHGYKVEDGQEMKLVEPNVYLYA